MTAADRQSLNYLAPESTVLRRFTAPGISVNTGSYRAYLMPIHNGRPIYGQFTLDRNGFALIHHPTAVTDFTDWEEVGRIYVPEVAEFVKSYTGADRVATMRWMLRRSAAPGENTSQPQAALVHDDYSVVGARETAEATYQSHFPDGPGFRRALITSLWRVFSPPPPDWPLAICDYTGVGSDEGLDNRMYLVDKIPDDLYAEMPVTAPEFRAEGDLHAARDLLAGRKSVVKEMRHGSDPLQGGFHSMKRWPCSLREAHLHMRKLLHVTQAPWSPRGRPVTVSGSSARRNHGCQPAADVGGPGRGRVSRRRWSDHPSDPAGERTDPRPDRPPHRLFGIPGLPV